MSADYVNEIKTDLLAKITAEQTPLGLKSIKADISPQIMVDAITKELPNFPGLILNFAGETITRQGTTMIATIDYAAFIGVHNVSAPYASGTPAITLKGQLVDLIDGQRFSNSQKTWFEYVAGRLEHQDATLVIYQLIFRTTAVRPRRTL